jgi:hypothetical protein
MQQRGYWWVGGFGGVGRRRTLANGAGLVTEVAGPSYQRGCGCEEGGLGNTLACRLKAAGTYEQRGANARVGHWHSHRTPLNSWDSAPWSMVQYSRTRNVPPLWQICSSAHVELGACV